MPKTETTTEVETVADERKRVYYTNREAKDILVDKLRTNKVPYLSVAVRTREIEVVQAGENDSAGALISLFTIPGIYGPGGEVEPVVRLDRDQFKVVTRTVLTLSRDNAEPMFENDGINDGEEGTENAPDPTPAVTTEPNQVNVPVAGSPEAVAQYTEAELDDVLEGHGIEAGTFDTVEAKREAVQKIVFID